MYLRPEVSQDCYFPKQSHTGGRTNDPCLAGVCLLAVVRGIAQSSYLAELISWSRFSNLKTGDLGVFAIVANNHGQVW